MEPSANPEDLAKLEGSLTSVDPSIRRQGAQVLERLGPGAVAILRRGLAHPNKYVRREAAGALGRLGREARSAVPALAQALKDPDPKVRLGAALALQAVGPDAHSAVPELMEALKATNLFFCRLVAKTLVQIGAAAVPALVVALGHPDRYVRREVAWAIGQLGPVARPAVPMLIAALANVGPGPTEAAAPPRFEKATGDADTRPTLIQLVRRAPEGATAASGPEPVANDAAFRLYAIRALGSIGPEAQSGIPVLTTLLSATDEKTRGAVQQALDQIRKQ